MSDLSVEAGGSLRELNLAGGDIGRAALPGCHKSQAALTALGKDRDKELQSLQLTTQRDQNTIDGMTSELQKVDTEVGPANAATCEQSVNELRQMYFRVQRNYKQVGQNTVVIMDRLKIIGEKYEKALPDSMLNLKEAKCKPLLEKRKAFIEKYKEARENVAKLASGYNARANDTSRAIAAVPAGYCKVGDAAATTVTNVNNSVATVTNANESLSTVTDANDSVATVSEVSHSLQTVTNTQGGCRGLSRDCTVPPSTPASGCTRGLGRPEDCR